MPKYSEIELTRREFDPYDGGWRNYAPIIIHLENELSIDDKICTIADHIEDTWSIQRKDLDMDYLALFLCLTIPIRRFSVMKERLKMIQASGWI